MLKFTLLALLAVTLYLGVSCSPVQFNSIGHSCTLSSPCLTSQGLLSVDQDFPFNATNQVDILVVDDNSGSMSTEQGNMGSRVNGFINNLNASGLNYQIGVTNTDVCNQGDAPPGFCPGPSGIAGALGTFFNVLGASSIYGNNIITPTTPNGATVFNDTVQRGENQIGSGDERGIFAAVLATQNKGAANPGFLRPNANLAVVILSDEDERSVGGNCTVTDPADPAQNTNIPSGQCDSGFALMQTNDQPQTLISQINSDWGGSKQLNVYSIIIIPDDMTTYPDPNDGGAQQTCLQLQSHQGPYFTAHPGTTYQTLSQMTGGLVGSICDNGAGAFANVLSSITTNIQNQTTSNVITLAYAAASTPTVTFTPAGDAVSWTWNGTNQITLSTRPAAGTIVHVNYSYASSTQTNFQKNTATAYKIK